MAVQRRLRVLAGSDVVRLQHLRVAAIEALDYAARHAEGVPVKTGAPLAHRICRLGGGDPPCLCQAATAARKSVWFFINARAVRAMRLARALATCFRLLALDDLPQPIFI